MTIFDAAPRYWSKFTPCLIASAESTPENSPVKI